jgi:hypothetical protein
VQCHLKLTFNPLVLNELNKAQSKNVYDTMTLPQ